METIIRQGLARMGLAGRVPEEAPERLARYGRLLLEKNQVMNLTAIRDEAGVARLHMLDCAALLDAADLRGKTLIDVGSGAGFPGLALKILCPELSVTLLDSLGKRVDWLREVAAALDAPVDTVCARAEEQSRRAEFRDAFDFATARAVAELRLLCELCLPFVKVGGAFLAMKGADCGQELDGARRAVGQLGGKVERCVDYDVPGTDVKHRLVVIHKVAPTPERFPRSWARIKAKPL